MTVQPFRRQPYWITVQTLPADRPGLYTGTVTVCCSDEEPVAVALRVRVRDVTMPQKPMMRTLFCTHNNLRHHLGGRPWLDVLTEYTNAALKHRLTLFPFMRPERRADGSFDFSQVDAWLDRTLPNGLTVIGVSREQDMLVAQKQHLQHRGLWSMACLYGWDECPPERVGELRSLYLSLKQAVPDVPIMQTGWSPHPDLRGLVQIWCPLTTLADMNAVREAQARGEVVWWYVCCQPTGPNVANLFVDYDGIDHRILGWQTWQYGIQGLLYWGLDWWYGNDKSAEHYYATQFTDWNPLTFGEPNMPFNGDGYLFYPGLGGRPLPSVRIAMLRDGLEDHDLLAMAQHLANRSPEAARLLRSALKIDKVSRDLTHYTRDTRTLLNHRSHLLQALERCARLRVSL